MRPIKSESLCQTSATRSVNLMVSPSHNVSSNDIRRIKSTVDKSKDSSHHHTSHSPPIRSKSFDDSKQTQFLNLLLFLRFSTRLSSFLIFDALEAVLR